MARQPLSILYEQKRNLNIKINKKKAAEKRQEVQAEEAPPSKKKGGLKFTSKLDANKAKKPIEPAEE